MENYKGKINKVYEKNGRWSLAMDDEKWYSIGKDQPKHSDGSAVQDGDLAILGYDTVHKNGREYRNVVDGKTKFKKGDGPPKKQSNGRKGGGSNYQQKEKYWEDKEKRDIETQKKISYAGAINSAIQLVDHGLSEGYLKMTGKAASKMDAYMGLVLSTADQLYPHIQSTPDRHEDLMGADEVIEEEDDGFEESNGHVTGDDDGEWDDIPF